MTAFARDVKTGALTQLRGAAGCVRPGGQGGCASGVGLAGATALAIAPDGRSLYVAGRDANAVASFSIDPVGGALLQLGGKGACIRGGDSAGACPDGRALLGADALAISPDGAIALRGREGRRRGRRPAARRRPPARSRSSPARPAASASAGGLGCATARALAQPSALAIAPGGRDLYVASASGNAISLLQRDAATGLLIQPAGAAGCIGQGIADCSAAPLLTAPPRSRSAPDGTSLTVATAGDGTILTLHRDTTTGLLAADAGARGLHLDDRRGRLSVARRCSGRRPRSRSPPRATCCTPPPARGLIALARQAPPVCLKRELRAGVGVPTQILLPCTDPNGDALTYAIASKATHGSAGRDQGRVRDLPAEARLPRRGRLRRHGQPTAPARRPRPRVTVRVTRDGTGPVVRLAAGPLKVQGRHGARHDRL